MSEFNKESVEVLCDHIITALQVCLQNKETWKTDKYAMLKLLSDACPYFYETYPRVCRTLILNDDNEGGEAGDITPLLAMIQLFGRVQAGEISFSTANNSFSKAMNSRYVDDVLNSDKLKTEREQKMRDEKIKVVD
ncbi:MAG: hypothetical protein Gaeavirus4_8 [Gaeavirus sp.]|uniref:Uncharacterized protein n=1 Tax=Gaeavirus sp. TaxID=2487767 RepID=A0A3G4ZYJ0_9VIRU|nr:MAG: hypothetical protein Gaeavirus4_8 [Gaeavirus sp.]